MEIKEVIEKKEALKQNILDLVRDFQAETGLIWIDIDGYQYYEEFQEYGQKTRKVPTNYVLEVNVSIRD